MSDFFTRLAARALDVANEIRPRAPSLYEATSAVPITEDERTISEHVTSGTRAASEPPPTVAPAPSITDMTPATPLSPAHDRAPAPSAPRGTAVETIAPRATVIDRPSPQSTSVTAAVATPMLRPAVPIPTAPLTPADRRPEVRVTIGRIDVRAPAPAAPPRPAPPPRPASPPQRAPRPHTPGLSLDDYLAQRRGGTR